MKDRRVLGAIGGGLVAGLAITALLMKGERDSGEPSELAELERRGARKLGFADVADDDQLPDAREQAVIQGGHLLLSAAAGAAYAVTVDDEANMVVSGIGFGLAFYAAMHWVLGPLFGLKQPEWRADAKTIGMHTANHLVFGLATAAGARIAARA